VDRNLGEGQEAERSGASYRAEGPHPAKARAVFSEEEARTKMGALTMLPASELF
jgi:hypothetical protein